METPVAFDNAIIISSNIYPICGDLLTSVAKKDYRYDYFNPDILCLDMDEYERREAQKDKREKVHSMDAVIGIKTFHKNRFSKPQFLLIELRIDYKSPKNLSKFTLENKVRHTLSLLSTDTPIYHLKYFIFNDKVIHQMINWFHNKSKEGGIIQCCRPISVTEFNNFVKSERDFPYKPEIDIQETRRAIESYLDPWDSEKFFEKILYWLRYAQNITYKPNEYNFVMQMIKGIWRKFLSQDLNLSEDEQLQMEIIEEDYLNFV